MRTKLDLGSSGVIDLSDEVAYSLNFAIADIRDPEKRNASYSKTIKIPGSKANDKIFQYIWNIDIDCNFNPNIKARCILSIDEMPQLTGYLQLIRINVLDNKKIEYEVVLRGQVGNIFTAIGDLELTDLDLSEWNHQYLKSVQKASWTAPIGEGYVYPLIDYGHTNGQFYDVEDFYPAIYVKEYLDKIFLNAGFTYSSTFFNTDFFKSLIIPCNFSQPLTYLNTYDLGRLDVQMISANQIISINNLYHTSSITTKLALNYENEDTGNQYDNTTYVWTAAESGKFKLIFDHGNARVTTGTADVIFDAVLERGGAFSSLGQLMITCTSSSNTLSSLWLTDIQLYQNDKIHIGIAAKITSGATLQNLTIDGNSGCFLAIYRQNISVSDGMPLYLNKAIPTGIKQRDFITSIIKMFNLYFDVDKENENKIFIEPRNDFYNKGSVIDWTNKLDVSQDLILEPMGELDARKYLFSYKPDTDYWNTLYQNNHGEVYSTKENIVANDFLKNEKKTEVIFSATPNVQAYFDRAIPQIITLDNLGSVKGVKGCNVRMLYYGGVFNTSGTYTYASTSGNSTETTYPYCGMIDNPSSPSLTLDWDVPDECYFDTGVYSNNNLFNKYYKQFIEEITDKDSKIVTGWFALTPYDILKLDFRNEFFVDGHFLRLNKVYDYNPIVSHLTKCEFIKIKRANSFVPQKKGTTYGSITADDIYFDDGTKPPKPISGQVSQIKLGNIVSSDDNHTSQTARAIIVSGARNTVGDGAKNISILNSSAVIVFPNVTGATVINSSGVTIADNDKLFINDKDLTDNAIVGDELTLISGAIDGANIAYEWSDKPNIVILNGKIKKKTVEYLLTKGTYWKTTFYVAPVVGDYLWAH